MKALINNKKYIIVWIVLGILLFIRYYDGMINSYDSTILALNYSYGFMSRGFIGTIYYFLDLIMPGSMYTNGMALKFSLIATVILVALFLVFLCYVLVKTEQKTKKVIYGIIIYLTLFSIPFFSARQNFGRVDLYLVMISIIAVILLVEEKIEWLLVPLTSIAIMIHQGYAFMYYNVVLILLVYKIFNNEKKRKKYIAILLISLITCICLFFYFELFSHNWGEEVYNAVVSNAKLMDKKYHKDLLSHEILGVDLKDKEVYWHYMNVIQLPFFLIFFSPYIYFAIRILKGTISRCETKKDKILHIIIALGSLTLLPNFLLKVDYGRWVYAVIFYYCITFIAFNLLKDKAIVEETNAIRLSFKDKPIIPIFLLTYAVLFQPLLDVGICDNVVDISEFLNSHFLHLWGGDIYVR